MRLKDLKKDILEMTEEELRDKVRAIRADRIIRKQSKATKVAKAKTSAKASDKAAKLLEGMSKEELAKLLEELE